MATLTASWPVSASTTSSVSVGLRSRRDRLHLGHQLVVDVEAAGGIEQDDVIGLELGRLERAPGDLDRLLAGDDRQRVDVRLAAEHRELLLRRGPGDVERRHQHLLALALGQPLGELGGGRGLARALEPDHHDHRRRADVEVELGGLRAQRLDQRVVDDLDDHLPRRDRAQHFLADRFLGDLVDEIARDRQSDVGLEQGDAHFAHRRAHVGLRERAAPAKPVEYAAEPIAQRVEHSNLLSDASRAAIWGCQTQMRRRTKPRRPACTLGRSTSMYVRVRRRRRLAAQSAG